MPTIKLKLPSNRTLGNICVYGAVASISAVMYMRWKMQDRVRNTDYYKLALQTLRQHKGAASLLGEPIKESGFELSNVYNTCDAEKAQFEVKVHGTKDKGTIFFWAKNNYNNGWVIDRLELETKQHPNKRFLLKKPEEYSLPDNLDKSEVDHAALPSQEIVETILPLSPSPKSAKATLPPDPYQSMHQTNQDVAQDHQQPSQHYAQPLQKQQEPPPFIQTAEGGRMQ